MRILVFDQSSPVHPVSESRGGITSVTDGRKEGRSTEILVSNIGYWYTSAIARRCILTIVLFRATQIHRNLAKSLLLHAHMYLLCFTGSLWDITVNCYGVSKICKMEYYHIQRSIYSDDHKYSNTCAKWPAHILCILNFGFFSQS